MSKYKAPHRASSKRSLSHRTQILITASLLIPISLLAITKTPAKAATDTNPIYATIQYVNNAINTALSQNSTSKSLRVYDANGQELGLLINHGSDNTNSDAIDTVYSPALKRFIYLVQRPNSNNYGGFRNRTTAVYQTPDCTGTAYTLNHDLYTDTNDLLPFSPQVFYIFDDSETSTTITINSQGYWNWSTNTLICTPSGPSTLAAYQLHPVSLPFSTPVVLPLQYKYQ
jgi:hypothetical protein